MKYEVIRKCEIGQVIWVINFTGHISDQKANDSPDMKN